MYVFYSWYMCDQKEAVLGEYIISLYHSIQAFKSLWKKVLVFDTLMVKTTKKLQVIHKFLETSSMA